MNQASRFPHLVVIGASAGGLEALSTLVSTLAPDFPAPVVIAQHLDPTRLSHLADILAVKSTLPVKVVPEHEPLPLQPGIISVVPAGRHVHIDDSQIALLADGEGRPKPSIDLLLGSAAQVYGERLVAVILTGMGSDGASGALAVNAAGGTVVIQNPDTARFPSMPRSLAPTSVDVVADVERIGPILTDLLRGDSVPSESGERKLLEGLLYGCGSASA